MFVDHIGLVFFPNDEYLRVIGRLSFPIFAFLVAEGFVHTRSRTKYLYRLLLFAFVAQPFYSAMSIAAAVSPFKLNILFTLAAGLGLLMLLEKREYFISAFYMLLLFTVNIVVPFDFGIYGVLLILTSYIFITKPNIGAPLLLLLIVLDNVIKPYFWETRIFALAALIPLFLYNGKLGYKVPRYVFYAIYPVHMAIIALVSLL